MTRQGKCDHRESAFTFDFSFNIKESEKEEAKQTEKKLK